MKKACALVATLIALAALPLGAEIGENFQKGGIGLAGSGSFYKNLYYFQDETITWDYWSLALSPELDFYTGQNFAWYFSPWIDYAVDTVDSDNVYRDFAYGVSLGLSYALVPDPAAHSGLVPVINLSAGIQITPTVDDLVAGVETPNNYAYKELLLTAQPRLYFFVNDRVAPYVSIRPQLIYTYERKTADGVDYPPADNRRWRSNLTFAVGMAYFVPRNKASIF